MTDLIDNKQDVLIRVILLFEYYKRSCGKSNNPEMHFYVIPELREIDNKIIEVNATFLIDNNLVRGGVDVDASHSFPWITRINSTGVNLIEKIIHESKLNIIELKDESDPQDKILDFITYCLKFKEVPKSVLSAAKNIVL